MAEPIRALSPTGELFVAERGDPLGQAAQRRIDDPQRRQMSERRVEIVTASTAAAARLRYEPRRHLERQAAGVVASIPAYGEGERVQGPASGGNRQAPRIVDRRV